MSQRHSEYERRLSDDYPTPPWPSQLIVSYLPSKVLRALDPAVGAGGMVSALNQIGLPTIGTGGDFLQMTVLPDPSINLIITNPPYGKSGKLAVQFIEHALQLAPIVAMLLRVDFDSGRTRQHLFRNCPAFACKVTLLDRIEWFPGEYGSSTNHAWFIWDREHNGPPVYTYAGKADVGIESPRRIAAQANPTALARSNGAEIDDVIDAKSELVLLNLHAAHSPFGGSVAARILRCPGSVQLVAKVPPHLRKTSDYAKRGTALHATMTHLLDDSAPSIDSVRGKSFNDYTVTADDIDLCLRPVLAYVLALLDTPGAEFFLEHRVIFPGITNTFGTCDLIVRIGQTIHMIDLKFGAGVRVLALYPDGDEDILNAQLLFYAAAARHSLPEFFAGVDTIVLTILQPVSIETDTEMVSSVAVTQAELDAFVTIYRAACAEALSPAPRLERGDWCRFCPAKPICPAHTAPLLDLAQFAVPTPGSAPSKDAYLQLLADGLNLVDAIKDLRVALHDQAKHALESGDVVPGYALSAGRAERHWQDEHAAFEALIGLGLARDDVIAEEIRSPKQIELRAKARGLKVPAELIVSHRSGVSLMRCENAHAALPGRGEIVRLFSVALSNFLGKEEI
jgi:hypothetical protein